jgi:S1-C subfamily serine protease
MKNTILSILKSSVQVVGTSILVILLGVSTFLSCVTINSYPINKNIKRFDTKPPVDAFAFVKVVDINTPTRCLPSKKYNTCLQVIDKLPPIETAGIGSGLLIKAQHSTIVLTAAHVCQKELTNNSNIYEKNGIKIELELSKKITVRSSTGEEQSAIITKIDFKTDLCALKPTKIYADPVAWSKIPPKLGDKVYAISAPAGINAPTMNLIYTGFYSGYISHLHHYTIPTRPGSSGSIVLNKNFKGVGMLNAAYLVMETIGIGTGHKAIRLFLDDI